jgi:hypothetical protein
LIGLEINNEYFKEHDKFAQKLIDEVDGKVIQIFKATRVGATTSLLKIKG